MNVLRVAAVMEAKTVTGPAKNLLRFCRLARNSACQVSIITFVRTPDSGALFNDFIGAAKSEQIEVHVIHEKRRFDPGVLYQLRSVLRQHAPDIVQTHGIKAHLLACVARPDGMPWLAYHHGYTAEDLKMKMYNRINRFTLPRADTVVTVCRPFAEMLQANGVPGERIRILPNSIEPAFAATENQTLTLRERWGIPKDVPVVLCVGRLSLEKGHQDLIAAAALIRILYPARRFRILIVGDGPERRRLEESIAAAHLQDWVTITGLERNVLPYYKLASLFVLPSHSEGSPNVLLEAMIARVPVIACSVGGVPETVRHQHSAVLVEPRQPEALAAAIENLLADPAAAQELAGRALSDVRSHHSPESYCSSLVSIYRDMLGA